MPGARSGKPVGTLAGLPVAVKDVLCERGRADDLRLADAGRTFGRRTTRPSSPSCSAADAVLIGRTNMDEFAMGGSTENSAFQDDAQSVGPRADARRLQRRLGGGVAAGMAPLAIGTDTGGSIRQPAGLCGVVGMKPTYGRVSRYGLVAFASSLDQVGPFGQSVEDVALLAGSDRRPRSARFDVARRAGAAVFANGQPAARRAARSAWSASILAPGFDAEVEAAVRAALDVYKSLGATMHEISLPHSKYARRHVLRHRPQRGVEQPGPLRRRPLRLSHRTKRRCWPSWPPSESSCEAAGDQAGLDDLDTALVRMYRRTRAEGFGPEVKRRIMLGTYALSAGYYDAYYLKALKVRRLIRQDFDQAFEKVDLIAGPITAAPAFKLGEMADDPLAMYLVDLYTVSANLAGIPGHLPPLRPIESPACRSACNCKRPPLEEDRLLRGAHVRTCIEHKRPIEHITRHRPKQCALSILVSRAS